MIGIALSEVDLPHRFLFIIIIFGLLDVVRSFKSRSQVQPGLPLVTVKRSPWKKSFQKILSSIMILSSFTSMQSLSLFFMFVESITPEGQFATVAFWGLWFLSSTNQGLEIAIPVLLVDGYNVCGYWAKLKKHFMSGRLDIARQKLIDELVTFSVLKGLLFSKIYTKYFFVIQLQS